MRFLHNTIKDPHWYGVQESDTTMLTTAASLPGQQNYLGFLKTIQHLGILSVFTIHSTKKTIHTIVSHFIHALLFCLHGINNLRIKEADDHIKIQ